MGKKGIVIIMSKDTFYFMHECNARTDRKLIKLMMTHGMEGIGLYWCLIEMLYEETGYLPLDCERISFELRTDTNLIQSVIKNFDLFIIKDEKYFYSDAVLKQLQERCEKSEKARKAITYRWDKLKAIPT